MEYKFKVGDKVKIRDSELPITDNWLGEGNRITHQGPFIIEKLDGGCVVKMSGIRVMLSLNRFELYEEIDLLEQAKLKYPVGSKVICLSNKSEEVVNSNLIWKDGNKDTIIQEEYPNTRIYRAYGDIEWAEIISSPESKLDIQDIPRYQFKIGDKVRVLSESDGWSDVEKGDIGIVRAVYPNLLLVDFSKQKNWYGKPECFELVKEITPNEFERELKMSNQHHSIPPVLNVSITRHPVTFNEASRKSDILPDIILIKSNRLDTKVKNTYVTLPEIKKKNKTIKF